MINFIIGVCGVIFGTALFELIKLLVKMHTIKYLNKQDSSKSIIITPTEEMKEEVRSKELLKEILSPTIRAIVIEKQETLTPTIHAIIVEKEDKE